MTKLQLATSDRQSYNEGLRACWLLFTRLSMASVDPPRSLIRQTAALPPISIYQSVSVLSSETTHAALSSFSPGVSRRARPGAQIDDTGTAKIDYDRRGHAAGDSTACC